MDCDKTGEVTEIDNSRYQKTLHIRLDNGIGTWENPYFVELALPKQPELKPEVKLAKDITKPAIAKYTLDQKKKWLKQRKDTKSIVWVEHPDYTGIATLGGKSHHDNLPWKVTYDNGSLSLNVAPDNISILKSLAGDIQPIPETPESDQVELQLEQLPEQTESPKQRVKRLAKQMNMGLNSKDFADYLGVFGKSKLSELNDNEATRLGDKLEEQIERFEKTKRDLGLH
ncbi:MAG: hypothetical protein VKK42_04045 [Lyngbya sp.]|nr:hypothetical protein [Lyngbya sp.]